MPAISYTKTGTTDDSWDGPAAMKNVTPDKAHLRALCAWVDPDGDADKKSSYKFPHHDVSSDGTVGAANLKACSAVIAALNGGRGGTSIPEADRQGVYDHVAHHLRDGGEDEVPDLRSSEDLDAERAAIESVLGPIRDADVAPGAEATEVPAETATEPEATTAETETTEAETSTDSPDGEAGDGSVGGDEPNAAEPDNGSGEAADTATTDTTTTDDVPTEPPADERSGEIHVGREGKQLKRHSPKNAIRAVTIGADGNPTTEGDGRPGVELKVITYGVVDDYGSLWTRGCLNAGLEQRLPQLAWSHQWDEPLGRCTAWQDTPDGPVLSFYFDDFDAVPQAKRAYAQVQSGTIDDCSVGFSWNYKWRPPTDDELKRYPDCTEVILEAALDEVSLVLRGAVPNAKVLTLRSARGMQIDKETAAQIIVQFAQGNCSLVDALTAVQNASVNPDDDRDFEGDPMDPENQEDASGQNTITDWDGDGDDDTPLGAVIVNINGNTASADQGETRSAADIDDELFSRLDAALDKVFG